MSLIAEQPNPRMDTSRTSGAVSMGYWHNNCYYGSYRSKLGQTICVKVDLTNGSSYVIPSRVYEQYAQFRNQSEWDRIDKKTELQSNSYLSQPIKGKGLGDKIESAINLATFGKGKRVAKRLARILGKKDCGCNSRKKALNDLGKKVGM